MPTLGNALDFAKYEARNLRAHILGTAPGSPVTGQMFYNSADNTLYWWDGGQWVSARGGAAAIGDATTSSKGIVQLAGDLAGTAASPQIAAGVITDVEVAAANKDGASATACMRTLGQTAGRAMPGTYKLNDIIPPDNLVNVNGQRLTSVADPTNDTDAANKLYVDNAIQGLDAKQSVKLASTAYINLTTGSTPTIDGVLCATGDRILVKDQANLWENGIYIVQGGAWTRAPDADATAEMVNAYVWVEQGTVNSDTGWVQTVSVPGFNPGGSIVWTQFSGAGQITAGDGMTKSGNTLHVGAGGGLTVMPNSIGISSNGITNAMLADGAVNLATADVTGILPVAKGGTDSINGQGARINLGAAGIYSQVQATGAASYTITAATHGQGSGKGKIVQLQIDATGEVIMADVTVASNGDVTVTFGATQSAGTIRVTILGAG